MDIFNVNTVTRCFLRSHIYRFGVMSMKNSFHHVVRHLNRDMKMGCELAVWKDTHALSIQLTTCGPRWQHRENPGPPDTQRQRSQWSRHCDHLAWPTSWLFAQFFPVSNWNDGDRPTLLKGWLRHDSCLFPIVFTSMNMLKGGFVKYTSSTSILFTRLLFPSEWDKGATQHDKASHMYKWPSGLPLSQAWPRGGLWPFSRPLNPVTWPAEGHFSWGHSSKVSLCPCLIPLAQATMSLGRQSGCAEEKIRSLKLTAFLCFGKADLGKMPERTRHIYRVLFDLLFNAPCRVIQVKWECRISKGKLKEDSKYKLFVEHQQDFSLLCNIFPLTELFLKAFLHFVADRWTYQTLNLTFKGEAGREQEEERGWGAC